MSIVYLVKINDTPKYIGRTDNIKRRLQEHKSNCYNDNSNGYDKSLYKTIRQPCIEKD